MLHTCFCSWTPCFLSNWGIIKLISGSLNLAPTWVLPVIWLIKSNKHGNSCELYLKKAFSIFVKLLRFNYYSCSKQIRAMWHKPFHFFLFLKVFAGCFCRILASLWAMHDLTASCFSSEHLPSFPPVSTLTNLLHVCVDELISLSFPPLSPGLHFQSVSFEGLIDLHLIHLSAEHYIYTSTLLSVSNPEGWEWKIKV